MLVKRHSADHDTLKWSKVYFFHLLVVVSLRRYEAWQDTLLSAFMGISGRRQTSVIFAITTRIPQRLSLLSRSSQLDLVKDRQDIDINAQSKARASLYPSTIFTIPGSDKTHVC